MVAAMSVKGLFEMKTVFVATVLAAAFAAPALIATQAAAGSAEPIVKKVVITVSCFRGPWEEVIWDRPNAKFVDSLVHAGYDFPTAHAMAERICRDETNVGKKEGLRSQMLTTMAEVPPQ
jgi:hypothetical protein